MSTAFHPQSDGQTERLNRTLEEMLRIFVTYKQDNWDECLAAAEFAYNNSKQASTQQTPFELDCGQSPYILITINTENKVAASQEFLDHWNTITNTAKNALIETKIDNKNMLINIANLKNLKLDNKFYYQLAILILLLINKDQPES